MDELPADLLARIAAEARPAVERWWAGLSADDRRDALAAWDEAARDRFFAPSPDALGPVPVVIGGRFVPAEQPLVGAEWHADYFEYLLKYPELLLVNEVQLRTFHIGCTAHPEARAALAAGCIPAGFVCPLGSTDCPMRRMLAESPGQSIQLVGPRPR